MTFPGHFLAAKNLLPKKHMGQNFLIDPSTAEMIVRRAGVCSNDTVLEIGAGLGALSIPLGRSCKNLYAVEKDRDLIEILPGVLAANEINNAVLIHKNIFDVDLEGIARKEKRMLTIFGNLPYNISSQVVIWAIEHRHLIDRAVFMFQREVAKRIGALAGSREYGRLSVMVQYCGRVERIAKIEAHQFYPKPKVSSEVIMIHFDLPTRQAIVDEKQFSAVVKAAFGRRRKTLKNAFAESELNVDSGILDCMWEKTSIDPHRRAETLNVSEFIELTAALGRCRDLGS